MHFILLMLALACSVTVASAQTTQDSKAVGVRPAGYNTLQPLANAAPTGNAGLFVGVNEFTKDRGIAPLNFAVHDAIELAHLFVVELKLIPPENCVLLISGKPAENAKIIQQHLQQLENLGVRVGPAERAEILTTFIDLTAIATVSSQLLVCAFSSHGFNEDKIAYVMPQDGSRKLLSATAVPVDNLETSMTGSKAGHRLFFIDACQERVSAKGNNPVGNGASKLLIDALLKPTGQAKLVSCSPNQFSFENGSLGGVGHGVFTWHLLEALRGSAQPDAQNFIRLGAVSRYVSDGVQKWAQDNNRPLQTPKLECPEATRDLPLALRSSDLQTVIALLNARKTDDSFTAAFRDRLIQGLGKINPALESDQELLHNTQAFLRGDLSPRLFTRYAAGELDRILLAMAPVAPVKPAPADAPMKPAAPGFAESLGLKFVSIPAGEFRMGSDETAEDLKKAGFVIPAGVDPGDESPARTVRMSAFRMQTTEVTRGQFAEFVRSTNYKTDAEKDGKGGYGFNAESGVFEQDPKYTWRNAGFPQTDNHPVVNVSWNDADAFATWMTSESKKRAETVRYLLPTEAQFEYAMRAGATTRFATGDNSQSLDGHANVQDASLERRVPNVDYANYPSFSFDDGVAFTAVVGSYPKNAFGLYDMHGNVGEWCRDWYDAKYYAAARDQDPPGPSSGSFRVLRGGSWGSGPGGVRCAFRRSRAPEYRFNYFGFRLVLE
jgi:formylglycine-generating enzyme required for sulfatase activity